MGVADNRTYKNEYLFNARHNSAYTNPGDTAKDHPSIEVDPKINTTIKENPYRSNVEIEGKEVVLQPDLSALFNAVGKRHSQGGIDVMLKPNAFIFSDYEGLKLSPKDHELFELKEGGKNATNTPADVLKRNVNLKHYNGLVTNLGDPFKDDLAKKSSARMLEKYIATLGNIAFIQELKKGMPQGIPDFAQGSAPVYNTDLKNEIMENKQYMKAGGTVDNPYLPKAQMGMWWVMKNAKDKQKPNNNVPTAPTTNNWDIWHGDKLPIFSNRYGVTNAADKITNIDDIATKLGYTGKHDIKSLQQFIYNSSPSNRAVVEKWHNKYNVGPTDGMFDGKIGIRWANAINEILNPYKPADIATISTPSTVTNETPTSPTDPMPGDINAAKQAGKSVNWKFTPWQKLSHLNDLFNFLNVDKYGATREHYNATYTNPALVNPEQSIGDVKALATQQVMASNSLNPILRNAQASDAYGKVLNMIPGIRSQYDNQNVGIVNQFRQYNNQVKNNESLVNAQNDINYFRDATTAEVNYKNMKDHLRNTAMSNLLGDVTTNQKLAYSLLTQNNPAYGFDWNTGNFYRNPKNILDTQTDARADYLSDFVSRQVKDWDKMSIDQRNALLKILVAKGFTPSQSLGDNGYKRGGKIKNPYK